MKIVGENKLQLSSAGRQSRALVENQAGNNLLVSGATLLANIAGENIKLMDKQSQQSATFQVNEKENSFWRQYGGKESFPVDELPDEFVTESMVLRGQVPSAEVLPAMYQSFVKNAVSNASKIIDFRGSRNDWVRGTLAIADKKLTQVKTAANASLLNQIQKDQKTNYLNAMANGDYSLALKITEGMFASDSEKTKFNKTTFKKMETSKYKALINSGQDKEMIDASEFLGQKDLAYREAGGKLDNAERRVAKHELDRELNRLSIASSAVSQYEKENLNYDISLFKENTLSVLQSNPDAALALYNRTVSLNERTNNSYQRELREINYLTVLAGHGDFMNKLPLAERNEYVEDVFPAGLSDFEQAKFHADMKVKNEAVTELFIKDFMKAGVDTGAFGEQGLVAIDLNMAPELLSNNLQLRMAQYETLQAAQGNNLGRGMLTVDENQLIGGQLNKMSPEKQLMYAQILNNALGKKSFSFYRQLGKEGGARTLALAGAALNAGFKQSAETLMRGRSFAEKNPDEVVEIQKLVAEQSRQSLGTAYVNQDAKRRAVKEATFNAYVGLVKASGSLDAFLSLDGDLYLQAENIATGGLFEFNGEKFPVPEYGMSPDIMQQWLTGNRGIAPDYIDKVGAPMGTTSAGFIQDLNEGRYRLEPARHMGEYYVKREKDGFWMPIMNKDGGLWVLPYDASANRWPQGNPHGSFF